MPDELQTEIPANNPPPESPGQKEDVSGLKKKIEELIGQTKKLKEERDQIFDIFGTKDPETLKEFKESQKRNQEIQARIAQEISEKTSTLKNEYEQKLATERAEKEQRDLQLRSLLQDEQLRQLFEATGGRDYQAFKALLATQFRVVYKEAEIRHDGVPTYQIESIVDAKGVPIYSGKEQAKPSEILVKARMGEYGDVLKAAFLPYNQSSGGGLPTNGMNGSGIVSYPRSEQAKLLAQDRTGEIAQRIGQGKITFY